MPRIRRAKQFLPFSALAGLKEALAKKETEIVPRGDIAAEKAAEINQKLLGLEKGMPVTVTHFEQGKYIQTTGVVALLDQRSRLLCIEDSKIDFDNISDIDIITLPE